MCETSWSCKPTWIGKYTSEKSPNHLFVWLCCLGPLCGLDSITCVLLMCILNWKACMTLFQTYHVNTWISISLLHIISSTSVIKIYQHFTNLVSPPQKKEANPNTRNSSLYLGFSPWPSMPVRKSWALTISMFMKSPTFIHNMKLGWSSTTGSHIYSH